MECSGQHSRQVFSRFDAMSTDELREILRNDAFKKEDDAELDIDATLYIAGVIASREDATDTDAAWAEFERSYLPDVGHTTLYEEILSGSERADPVSHANGEWKRRLVRLSLIAAAVTLLLSATAFVAASIGWFRVWNADELWSRQARSEQSAQVTAMPKPSYYDEMAEALDAIGAPENMIPLWLPDGYSLTRRANIGVKSTTSLLFIFSNKKHKEIVLKYTSYNTGASSLYSKDEEAPLTYTAGGVEHTILTNINSYGAVWWRRSFECSIYGYESRDYLIKTIDSMYMEVKNE